MWRKTVLPKIIENFDTIPDEEKQKLKTVHQVFCGLHVIHNLGIYAEKALLEWEKIVEEEGSVHGGFKNSNNSNDLLYELSKLTCYTHGDQRNGKADEWEAFLTQFDNVKDHMVSFLHHRFNIIFVLGGAAYYHRDHLATFVNNLDGSNFLHESIRQDITNVVFLAANRALGIFNKMITGPLFRKLEDKVHIFSLNSMWGDLLKYLVANGTNATEMLSGNTFFDNVLVTKDSIYEELFKTSANELLESLTRECLEVMCITCSIMVQSQLKDQLPGGKYYQPSEEVLAETRNCPTTNVLSERDFAAYDRHLRMKPNLSTVAATGVIMFNNNKTLEWLNDKTPEEIKLLIMVARKNRKRFISDYRAKKRQIITFKLDKMEKAKLDAEIKEQKLAHEKQKLTEELDKFGGLITTKEELERRITNKMEKKLF